ncbi:hypothetical protein FDJ19_gp074 [Vibrio phage Ceto]|uniref:Uncharacterized protein n=1 Tax=Vibrio phage Ceto TaxID=2570300 RepID=A0A2H5BGG9_9CAUD|nr:hypothetical protein FDJ19_gp074 [Vibrio phage Ceto]AUG85081.1 hypothetical protein CETO_74 [Vibrio phage Ceto]
MVLDIILILWTYEFGSKTKMYLLKHPYLSYNICKFERHRNILMNMSDKIRYLTEILEHLVPNVNVTVVDPEGRPHSVRQCNLKEKVDILAEYPELRVHAEVYYDGVVHDVHHIVRPRNYKYFVVGQGKQIAKELKMELGCQMLGIR